MKGFLNVLFPEWQGYACDTRPSQGALNVAESLFDLDRFLLIEVPGFQAHEIEHGVVGLTSIASLSGRALALLKQHEPSRIFMIGGTCAAEIAPVSYLNELYSGQLAVIWLDAHGDLNTPSSSPSGHFHGMSLRTLLGEGPDAIVSQIKMQIRPEQVFLVGSRELDWGEEHYIETYGVHCTSGGDEEAAKTQLLDSLRKAGYDKIYLHIDVDVFDPKSFPDALMPTQGGYTLEGVASMIREIRTSFEIVGVSLLEFCSRSEEGISLLDQFLVDSGLKLKRGGPPASVAHVDEDVVKGISSGGGS